jgi:hypothetical protein
MKRTFFLLSILARILFAALFIFDLLLVARISGEFATHGVTGVRGWILHRAAGKIISEASNPAVINVQFPPSGPIFREFFIMCSVLLVVTPLSFWIGRFFGRKARQAR